MEGITTPYRYIHLQPLFLAIIEFKYIQEPFCILFMFVQEEHVDIYLKLKTLNPDQCWKSKDGFAWNKSCWNVQPKQVASFVELVLINTEKSLKLVVLLDERPYLKFKIEDLVATLPHNNNVTILLSTNKPMPSEEW